MHAGRGRRDELGSANQEIPHPLNMRILILGINYAPEMVGVAVYTSGMAESLAGKGHSVDVITAKPYYPSWKAFEGWSRFGFTRETPAPNLRVLHCPLYVPHTPSGAKRIVHHFSFAMTALMPALWAGMRAKPDVVLVVAPSMISAMLGRPVARLARAKTWLHIQDFEVEAAFATGLLQQDSRIGRVAKRFEAWVLRRFDRVSTISTAMMDKLAEKGVPVAKMRSLRNWADLSNVPGAPCDAGFKAELGITTPHVVLYSGNLANKQGLEVLPQVASLLAHRDDLTILICGEGPSRATLEAQTEGLDNIAFRPLQPKEQLGTLLSIADIHLLPQIAGAADLVLPSKLTNMLASGRPVIATTPPDSALAAELVEAGVVTPPGKAAPLAQAIEKLLDAPERRATLGKAARARALSHWAEQAVLDRFEQDLKDMIADEKHAKSAPYPSRLGVL
jgi:colanic acid biosynthesis glycosyl transferase WcaI